MVRRFKYSSALAFRTFGPHFATFRPTTGAFGATAFSCGYPPNYAWCAAA
jgi:hypothetical protein